MNLMNLLKMFTGGTDKAIVQPATTLQPINTRTINQSQRTQLPSLQRLPSKQMLPIQPDITYNANPNIDIPYSARTPELAQMGNRYTANPTSQEFLNVDPAQFGYPADNTLRSQGNISSTYGGIPQPNQLSEFLNRSRR